MAWGVAIVACALSAVFFFRSRDPGILQYASSYAIDEAELKKDLDEFTSAPHEFGSGAQIDLARYISQRAEGNSPFTRRQDFHADTPNPHIPLEAGELSGPQELSVRKAGSNILSFWGLTSSPKCVVLLGSHYDTKKIEGISYVGANDSASSSILLLDLLRYVQKQKPKGTPKCDIVNVWFDGEESILNNWHDGETRHPAKIRDNTYGSRHFVNSLVPCGGGEPHCLPKEFKSLPVRALVLLDMVGSPNLKISRDSRTPNKMQNILEKALADLQLKNLLTKVSKSIDDDHTPFLEKSIPAIDIIDFENLETWHNNQDQKDRISFASLHITGKIALYMALTLANE